MEKEEYKGQIDIYHLIDGAKEAEGLVVIIDVFRAFSLECYLYSMGVSEIRPVKTIEETFEWKNKDPRCILIGERNGKMCQGFDFGNSPSTVEANRVKGCRIIHTTSAGTQGVVNAVKAEQIITGSFVNARAIADYIKSRKPHKVSLVCMGTSGVRINEEDELCARYIKSLLLNQPIENIDEKLLNLKDNGGEHFFDEQNQKVYPEEDFWLCIKHDIFPFVIRVEKTSDGLISRKVDL